MKKHVLNKRSKISILKIRRKLFKIKNTLKRLLTISALGAVTLFPLRDKSTASASSNRSFMPRDEMITALRKQTLQSINEIVEIKSTNLQNQIIHNIDSLQKEIRLAKKRGGRRQAVRSIFHKVYPEGGFFGGENYCVAGAMLVQIECNDSVLNQILPNPAKTAVEYNFGGHPNVSCPSMRRYFKETLGENYADRKDKNFKEFIKTLEPGDIITVYSRRNTSSGEHCVTCIDTVKEGKIRVGGFNNESTYNVPISQIVGAAKVMKQYREKLEESLEKDFVVPMIAEGKINSADSFQQKPAPVFVRNIVPMPVKSNLAKAFSRD